MSLVQVLKSVVSFLKPYTAIIGAITVIYGSIWGVYKFLFRPQDLSVFVQREEVNFPSSIGDRFANVYNALSKTTDTSLAADAKAAYRYLQNTNNFWIITLRNETRKPIKDVSLRISGVSSLGAWAVNSDFLLQEERDKLLQKFAFDSIQDVMVLKDIEMLPGSQQLKVYVWGKLSGLSLEDNLIVTYGDGQGHVGLEYTATGFKAFLCEYLYELALITVSLFLVAYFRLLKKHRHAVATSLVSTTSVTP